MGTSYNPKIITNGLILNLDAANRKSYPTTGASWTDLTTNKINCTLYNSPTFSSSNVGYLTFNGTNQYAQIPVNSSYSFSTSFTLGCWFYANSNGIDSTLEIFHKRNNAPTYVSYGISWRLPTGSSNNNLFSRVGFTDGTVSDLNSSTLSVSGWYYGVQTYNGSSHILYINGLPNVSGSVSKTIKDDGIAPTIASFNGSSEFFSGRVSICQLYNRALTAFEILQNYNATKGRFGL